MGVSNVQTVLLTGVAAAVTIIAIVYKRWKQENIPTSWEKVGSVTKIHLYPLKSGRRIELQRAEATDVGLIQTEDDEKVFRLRDRVFMVYGAKDNEFRSGRNYPKLVFVNVSVHDKNHVAIDAPNMKKLLVKIPDKKENKVVDITCCDKEIIRGIDCGDEAATWFSRYLLEKETGLRLAHNDTSKRRDITKAQKKVLEYYKNLGNESTGLFSDLTSVSLINQRSVNDLNERVADATIVAENFRHNIIIDGPDLHPYDEDAWDWVKIGDVVLRNVKDCTRCISTIVNPETGVRDPKQEPLKTLRTYRKHTGPEASPRIGNHLDVRRTGIIKVGDPVFITRQG